MKEKHFSLIKTFPLPKETIWNLLANNDHLNRMIGLFPVEFTKALFDDRLFYRHAKAKAAGVVPLSWKEYPFEWVKEERYVVQRVYTSGPLAEFNGGIELKDVSSPGNPATEVHVFSVFRPANALGKLALPVIALPAMKKTLSYIEKFINLHPSRIVTLPQPAMRSTANKQTLDNLLDKLPTSTLRDCLKEHLIQGADHTVVSMQPYKLADQWQEDREDVLHLFLEATKAGVLNLTWSLMCPNCRVAKEKESSLSQVKNEIHCDLCGISYQMTFDQSIELRFTVHPSIRQAVDQTYCIGGPILTPHILIQKRIAAGSTMHIPSIPMNEQLQLRILSSNHSAKIDQRASHEITYGENGLMGETFSLHNATFHNESENDIVLVIEEVKCDHYAVTAAKVTTMEPFRRLFSSEVLAKGQEIGIENVTILFSDLRGSTSLYEVAGDANAYRQVNDHFEFLSKWITHHNGSIIKTIGDSVMACFYAPEDALKAALSIQQSVESFNQSNETNLIIKLGMYNGPAIAVTANNQLDYFGHTVNLAARIEQESKGSDVILPAEMLARPQLAQLIEPYPTTTYEAKLNGIQAVIPLVRIEPLKITSYA
ncbi:adenylate/guanylate cyclase domain-containing protein [Alkalihalobacillus macyae]|uniref:adenylate/guanylate cyclase domain-containing protein n=1 Tax=Guptibacillus hwajinpoensis TaxID=208199 RepID=UPI00273C3CE0|nr:adenylate/guanylate cyclase domain-containing protein [Alkalihalobacillus macyae]MDP4553457.1 adenylate/guanylate cyclase domain-containing protein [Alkalihalobacillus macyae]